MRAQFIGWKGVKDGLKDETNINDGGAMNDRMNESEERTGTSVKNGSEHLET